MTLHSQLCIALMILIPVAASSSEPRVDNIEFSSHAVTLAGSIVYPDSAHLARAAVVFVHGSGPQTRDLGLARRFAAAGIVALVYDKRGAGKSGGDYEGQQSVSERNLSLLADDAVAALATLRSRVREDLPLGLAGISQAGWIVPLAAERSPAARFVLIWSGPVCKVSEEDIYSIHTRDTDSASPVSYQQAMASREHPYVWPDFLGVDTDPATSLRKLSIPGLWIFGAHDGSIPVDLSISRLKELKRAGHRYDHVLHDGQGHNNMEATFSVAMDWIRRQPR